MVAKASSLVEVFQRSRGADPQYISSVEIEATMPQKKHHYVPHFYLKHFASNPHRINILNLKDYRSYCDGPLKAQCYRNHLYGLDDSLEKRIAALETLAAPTISMIIQQSKLPARSTPQRDQLLQFLAMQMMRTPVAIDKVTDSIEQTRANLLSSYGGMSPQLDRQLSIRPYEAAKIALGHFDEVCECFAGLQFQLLLNGTPQAFITSDNPAFKYNLYCETVRGHGMLGASQSGFMLFTPLSPRHLIILFDKETYKCLPVHHDVISTTHLADVHQLNKMQVVNADCNLLFSNWSECGDITTLARKHAGLRKQKTFVVRELLPADRRPGNGILQYFEQTAILGLDLSFFKLRREAKRVPPDMRIRGYRHPFDAAMKPPPLSDPRWRTYRARG
jgi:hypothetical protein